MREYKEEQMTDNISSLFSGIEIQKRQKIISLMSNWRSEVAGKDKIELGGEYYDADSYFISDGFFPGYYNQKIRVLFIGRETRYMDDTGDYIESMIKYYKENMDHNQKAFTRHLLYIIQGIKGKGKLEFENLKTANDYAKEMVKTNDYGFAYMNISKYTNCRDDGGNADFSLINRFLRDSNLENRNYFCEELEILNPDIIITGNLWEGHIDHKYLDLCFGKFEWNKINDDIDGKVNTGNIILNGKNIKLLNTYGFPSRYSDKEFYYDPIMEIIFKMK
jgi:hypothetical protein